VGKMIKAPVKLIDRKQRHSKSIEWRIVA